MKTDGHGTILEGYHPSADSAMQFIISLDLEEKMRWLESFSSCAIEGNKLGEICAETLNRIMRGDTVSDRYLLGLAWTIKNSNTKETT